jgi:hypothetical protein
MNNGKCMDDVVGTWGNVCQCQGDFAGKHCQIPCTLRDGYRGVGFCDDDKIAGKVCRPDHKGLATCAPQKYQRPGYTGCPCGDDQYINSAPAGLPHQCAALTVCDSQGSKPTEYESTAPTTTTDRQCLSINDCTVDQYERVASCAAKTTQTNAGATCTMGAGTTCVSSVGSDAEAKASNGLGDCDYTPAGAPTATSNRVCVDYTVGCKLSSASNYDCKWDKHDIKKCVFTQQTLCSGYCKNGPSF